MHRFQMSPAAAPPYFLSRQAHVCVANDTVFILDSTTGKYLSLDKDAAAGLGSLILDWPIEAKNCSAPTVLQSLIDRCLITKDPELGKPATPSRAQLPTNWLRDGQPRGCPDITVSDLCRFSISAAYALYSKRFLPFRHTLSRVRRRKQATQDRRTDIGELASLVRVFDWLRPLGFRKTNECFLYCLALNEFLSKYDIYPTWIFAVRARPFAAHCWLQYGDQALTDIPFNLRQMVPILVL
jgi:Transglutaminase-like superfamily